MGHILDNVSSPEDVKKLDPRDLNVLAEEIREEIIDVTSRKGGHIAASLGAVDLTVALHYCFESPKDKFVWDVGHQSYAHKLLTGRRKSFETLREMGGISGFPSVKESKHDAFTCGHSSTSISTGLGLACSRDLKGEDHKVVSVIGDASLASGLAFEGLNNAGHMKTNLIVILNDNEQFISKPVGAMSKYLNKVIANPLYNKVREEMERVVKSIPKVGEATLKKARKFQESMKSLLVPGILFEELGFRYFGPIDGHNIEQLISMLNNIKNLKEPVFLHIITKKGKGYAPAEEDPIKFHGVNSFDKKTGEFPGENTEEGTFTQKFGEKIIEIAAKNEKVVAITAAMPDGTGLTNFADKFPERFFDVGITEPHAVAFSAGLTKGGLRPVFAVYSTFLQRSYDQLIHDVALQDLPVIICIDRAGLVGKDGPTHHGVFDIAYIRGLPGFIFMAPKDGEELKMMLDKAFEWNKPVAIRYPRAKAEQVVSISSCTPLKIGKAEFLREGEDLTIIALGSMVNVALKASEILSKNNIEASVINARFIKPLDRGMLEKVVKTSKRIFTIEEGIISGGFGSAILEFLEQENINNAKIRCVGLPDEFIEHGTREELLRKYHLSPVEFAAMIELEMKA